LGFQAAGYWLLASGLAQRSFSEIALLAARPDKTQIFDLLSYRGSSKNDEILDFWFFGITRYSLLVS
jgi:hypothetical protein